MMLALTAAAFRSRLIVLVALAALGLAMLIGAGQTAHAATGVSITVTTTADPVLDANNVCPSPPPGKVCSLRRAIAVANGDTHDVIHLPLSSPGTHTVYQVNNSLDVDNGMTIAGDDPQFVAVDGNNAHSVFDIISSNPVTITGITVQNGFASEGGGIFNQRTNLTLGNDIITNNVADDPEFGGLGAGIANENGSLTILSTTISNNVTKSDSVLLKGRGGGIYNAAGIETPSVPSQSQSLLTMVNDTVTGNSAGEGGGIYTTANALLNNDTIASNTAAEGEVGGIDMPSGILIISTHSTVAIDNTVGLHNTIVSKNTTKDCGPIKTTFVSTGHNIDSDKTCNLTAVGDQPGVDPLLAALAFNAPPVSPPNGFPNTMAIGTSSPAFNHADNTNCPIADERGVTRPQPAGGQCDVGAFELVLPSSGTLAAASPALPAAGVAPSTSTPMPWLAAALLTVIGGLAGLALVRRRRRA